MTESRLRRWTAGLRYRLSSRLPLPTYRNVDEAPDGYEERDIIETVASSTQWYREEIDSSVVPELNSIDARHLAVFASMSGRVRVVDFGGACGALFFLMDRLMPGRIESWTVVETSAMAAEAGRRFTQDRLSFVDSAEAAMQKRPFDLTVASGVLQYVPRPLKLLDDLIAFDSTHLYLSRSLVSTSHTTIITEQVSLLRHHGASRRKQDRNDRLVRQRIVLIPERELLSGVSKSYDVVLRFRESEEQRRRTSRGLVAFRTMGLFAKRREHE